MATNHNILPTSIAFKGAIEKFARYLPDDLGTGDLVADEACDEQEETADIKPATRLGVISVAEIVRRVDQLYRTADL